MTCNSGGKLDRVMTPEQFTQVVDAILEGKYSWACVLILRFAGYNPLHYIPYRTYNRLMKENCPHGRWGGQSKTESVHKNAIDSGMSDSESKHSEITTAIDDLDYFECAGSRSQRETKGGIKTSLDAAVVHLFNSFWK